MCVSRCSTHCSSPFDVGVLEASALDARLTTNPRCRALLPGRRRDRAPGGHARPGGNSHKPPPDRVGAVAGRTSPACSSAFVHSPSKSAWLFVVLVLVPSRPARQRRHMIRPARGYRSSSGRCAPSRHPAKDHPQVLIIAPCLRTMGPLGCAGSPCLPASYSALAAVSLRVSRTYFPHWPDWCSLA